jgi:hypothetical protein
MRSKLLVRYQRILVYSLPRLAGFKMCAAHILQFADSFYMGAPVPRCMHSAAHHFGRRDNTPDHGLLSRTQSYYGTYDNPRINRIGIVFPYAARQDSTASTAIHVDCPNQRFEALIGRHKFQTSQPNNLACLQWFRHRYSGVDHNIETYTHISHSLPELLDAGGQRGQISLLKSFMCLECVTKRKNSIKRQFSSRHSECRSWTGRLLRWRAGPPRLR